MRKWKMKYFRYKKAQSLFIITQSAMNFLLTSLALLSAALAASAIPDCLSGFNLNSGMITLCDVFREKNCLLI